MTYTFDATIISDLHKDAYGYRPREWFWADWNKSNDAQKQEIWDVLLRALDDEIEREKQEQAAAVADLEASIQRNLELGAADRETAIRWIIESLGLDEYDLRYGGSYICFRMGLPYDMRTVFDPICKALLEKMNDD